MFRNFKFLLMLTSFIFSFIFLSSFPLKTVFASSVVINEIAWMGDSFSPNNEWIELYNYSPTSSVDLNAWRLILKSGKTYTNSLQGIIQPEQYFILKRRTTNNKENIKADAFYKGSLKNSGALVELLDKRGRLIDRVSCSSGWFAGNNLTKQTMERINPKLSGDISNNWQTSAEKGGTPKRKNSCLNIFSKNLTKAKILNKTTNKNKVPLGFLLVGFIISLLSSVLFVIIKKKSSN